MTVEGAGYSMSRGNGDGRIGISKIKLANGVWKAMGAIDPALRGYQALKHPAVREWHKWVLDEYEPRGEVILLTPCSNRKPYPKSPQSAKIRGVLRRLSLWDPRGPGYMGAPRGVEWLYLSDLLLLVPYERATEYPACCYDLPPDAVLGNEEYRSKITRLLGKALNRLRGRRIVAYLPSKHKRLLIEAVDGEGFGVVWVNYDLFYGHRRLEETLRGILGR